MVFVDRDEHYNLVESLEHYFLIEGLHLKLLNSLDYSVVLFSYNHQIEKKVIVWSLLQSPL